MLVQANRQIRLSTPLQTDRLAFKSMRMNEQLGQLFKMELEFYSDDGNIPYDEVLGHPITVALDCSHGSERHFNGFVSRFGFAGSRGRRYVYKATAVPWFWMLTLTSTCRIFHNQTVEEIVSEIFNANGYAGFEFQLTRAYSAYEYCVQYRESDFAFVSRLLEREGIYYYFDHQDGAHQMVLTDAQSQHQTVSGYETYEYYARDDFSKRRREGVYSWRPEKLVESHRVALQDYDFKKPGVDLGVESAILRQHGEAQREVYDYPGLYRKLGDGDAYAKTRIEELQAGQSTTQAQSNLRGVETGRTFSLTSHPIAEYNIEYLVTGAAYTLFSDDYQTGGEETETFSCTFSALATTEVFRPARITPKPIIAGPQTAVVVANDGEEVCVDEHGRVLVHFH
ncbi:MAG: type VI secretion system Vgr family protein, partial [Paracoccaceae bacterium]